MPKNSKYWLVGTSCDISSSRSVGAGGGSKPRAAPEPTTGLSRTDPELEDLKKVPPDPFEIHKDCGQNQNAQVLKKFKPEDLREPV